MQGTLIVTEANSSLSNKIFINDIMAVKLHMYVLLVILTKLTQQSTQMSAPRALADSLCLPHYSACSGILHNSGERFPLYTKSW